MSGVIKKLYRRGDVSFSDSTERAVDQSREFTWTFARPGYFSFDFMCNVPMNSNGELPMKFFWVKVNGVKRYEVRAAWAWQRAYIYVDSGTHEVEFGTTSYSTADSAAIRRVIHRVFDAVDCLMIEQAKAPKPLNSINVYPILHGGQRYQRTGRTGSEHEFVIVFRDPEQWRKFMKTLEEVYVIKGDYGVYGGPILSQDTDTTRSGNLMLTKVKMNSPLTAGVGVDGL